MQRNHRNWHRLLWLMLGPLILLLLVAALISRPKWPTMETLPGKPVNSTLDSQR